MKPTTRYGCLALALLLTLAAGPLFAQTEKDKLGKDKPAPQSPPEAKPDPAKVAKQKAASAANWKRIVEEEPKQTETDHLIILAPAATKNIAEVGAYLEKAYAQAAGALKPTPEEMWPGKLTIYLVAERSQYKSAMRSVIRKQAEEDDRGGFQIEGEAPAAVGGPPVNARDLKIEQEAANQIAQALLAQKAKTRPPEWLVAGFGRATLLRVSPAAVYAREKQVALILVLKQKRTARDVYSGSEAILAPEAAVLRGMLVYFLAYSGATQKFPEFVTGFRIRDKKMPNPTTETALTRADVTPERLEAGWRAWLAR
jgi:hypothetical protein